MLTLKQFAFAVQVGLDSSSAVGGMVREGIVVEQRIYPCSERGLSNLAQHLVAGGMGFWLGRN